MQLDDPNSHGGFVKVIPRFSRTTEGNVSAPFRGNRAWSFTRIGIEHNAGYEGFIQGLFSDPTTGNVYLWINGWMPDLEESRIIEVDDILQVYAYSNNAAQLLTLYQNAVEDGDRVNPGLSEKMNWMPAPKFELLETLAKVHWPQPELIFEIQ